MNRSTWENLTFCTAGSCFPSSFSAFLLLLPNGHLAWSTTPPLLGRGSHAPSAGASESEEEACLISRCLEAAGGGWNASVAVMPNKPASNPRTAASGIRAMDACFLCVSTVPVPVVERERTGNLYVCVCVLRCGVPAVEVSGGSTIESRGSEPMWVGSAAYLWSGPLKLPVETNVGTEGHTAAVPFTTRTAAAPTVARCWYIFLQHFSSRCYLCLRFGITCSGASRGGWRSCGTGRPASTSSHRPAARPKPSGINTKQENFRPDTGRPRLQAPLLVLSFSLHYRHRHRRPRTGTGIHGASSRCGRSRVARRFSWHDGHRRVPAPTCCCLIVPAGENSFLFALGSAGARYVASAAKQGQGCASARCRLGGGAGTRRRREDSKIQQYNR